MHWYRTLGAAQPTAQITTLLVVRSNAAEALAGCWSKPRLRPPASPAVARWSCWCRPDQPALTNSAEPRVSRRLAAASCGRSEKMDNISTCRQRGCRFPAGRGHADRRDARSDIRPAFPDPLTAATVPCRSPGRPPSAVARTSPSANRSRILDPGFTPRRLSDRRARDIRDQRISPCQHRQWRHRLYRAAVPANFARASRSRLWDRHDQSAQYPARSLVDSAHGLPQPDSKPLVRPDPTRDAVPVTTPGRANTSRPPRSSNPFPRAESIAADPATVRPPPPKLPAAAPASSAAPSPTGRRGRPAVAARHPAARCNPAIPAPPDQPQPPVPGRRCQSPRQSAPPSARDPRANPPVPESPSPPPPWAWARGGRTRNRSAS